MRSAGCWLAVAFGARLLVVSEYKGHEPTYFIDVIVQRQDASFVGKIASTDLALTVDGNPRPIERIETFAEPVSVVVLMDMSESMVGFWEVAGPGPSEIQGQGVAQLVRGVEEAFAQRRPSWLRGRVARFAGTSLVMSEGFTADSTELVRAVRQVLVPSAIRPGDASGPSPMLDATARVGRILAGESGRRAIILLSDGESTGNVRSLEETAKELASLGVVVHTLFEGHSSKEDRVSFMRATYPPDFLRDQLVGQLSALTGGLLLRDDRQTRTSWGWGTPTPPFDKIFAAIRGSMRLWFSGSAAENPRVEIASLRAEYRVTAPRWATRVP